ncbi:hypothetical protein ACFYZB_22850 [Streptomyces sp. NPDC001852]|uniref:hypothetical protein n=1 Tax=Streptomyces sp. NPDC001852 TaxID=3364619 RepID=UPI00369946A4
MLLWAVSCTAAATVPLGLSLLSQWFVLFVWREGYHDLLTFLIFGCLPVYLGLPVLMFRYAKGHRDDRIGKWRAVVCFLGIVVVFGGLFSGVTFGAWAGDQQILHDRGATATGVITRTEDVRGDSGSVDGVETDVRLGDGTTTTVVADVEAGDRERAVRALSAAWAAARETEPAYKLYEVNLSAQYESSPMSLGAMGEYLSDFETWLRAPKAE